MHRNAVLYFGFVQRSDEFRQATFSFLNVKKFKLSPCKVDGCGDDVKILEFCFYNNTLFSEIQAVSLTKPEIFLSRKTVKSRRAFFVNFIDIRGPGLCFLTRKYFFAAEQFFTADFRSAGCGRVYSSRGVSSTRTMRLFRRGRPGWC